MTRRGTPIIRLSFPGVGMIERHSGFKDGVMVKRLKEMCRVLYEANREDVLRDIRDKRVSFREVWAVYRVGKWRKMPTAQHTRDFTGHFGEWIQTKPHRHYRANAKSVQRNLERQAGKSFALAELRRVLMAYRSVCESKRTGAAFNRALATVRSFLAATITDEHAIYLEVAGLKELPEDVKRKPNPQEPAAARVIGQQIGGEIGHYWWEMCLTGMMPDEYFAEKYRREEDAYFIEGTKREARPRYVPIIEPIAGPPTLGKVDIRNRVSWFGRQLKRAKVGVRPYDARHSFALWCDMAGLPESWKSALLGHAQRGVTQGYGWRESEEIIDVAGPKLRALVSGRNGAEVDTPDGENRVSASAPRRSRTPSLLIRSQTPPSTARNLLADEPETKGSK